MMCMKKKVITSIFLLISQRFDISCSAPVASDIRRTPMALYDRQIPFLGSRRTAVVNMNPANIYGSLADAVFNGLATRGKTRHLDAEFSLLVYNIKLENDH